MNKKVAHNINKLFENKITRSTSSTQEIPFTNEERRTAELIIGFVGPVGSGVTHSSKIFKEILENSFQYKVSIIKVSDLINENAQLVELRTVGDKDNDRIERLQTTGSLLREKLGEDVLANFCIQKIYEGRDTSTTDQVRRYCTIIDSLKNPNEVNRLRSVYGDLFWLVGVFAPEDIRINRLEIVNPNSDYLRKVSAQDYDEGTGHGQLVKDTMTKADFYIRNDRENDNQLRSVISRFLDRMFEINISTPNSDEIAMFAAASAAMQSACLSRQVGAVIQNKNGDIIGHGANDVPKSQGGLYNSSQDQINDHRCFNWKNRICHNDDQKEKIFSQIENIISQCFPNATDAEKIQFTKHLRKSRIKNLIEFSRAVHAEMAAIVSVAREGGAGILGSTLFSTTFPCHNCAKHIVASGITKVVYIEPYPKSLATSLHSDAITTNETQNTGKVLFLQYEGIAPRSFSRIFKANPDRKIDGVAIISQRNIAIPISASPIDSLVSREQMEVARLEKEKQNVQQSSKKST